VKVVVGWCQWFFFALEGFFKLKSSCLCVWFDPLRSPFLLPISNTPYKCPKRMTKDISKTTSEKVASGVMVKHEDQVMKEEGFGAHTLALFPTEPKPLTGTRLEAR
jgi:hypothetical protein